MEKKRFDLPDRIDSLQALRFLGAMCITVYHFSVLQGSCPFDFSHAVYLFYMISGFVVMLSTRKIDKKRRFLSRRLVRILPLYWGLTVFTFAAGQFFPSIVGYRPTAAQLVCSLFFIPFSRMTAKAGTAIRPLVGLGHTLQMEMLFYVLFLIAMRLNHKYRGFIAACFAFAVAMIGYVFPTDNPVLHFYTANPYVWTSFIVGLAVYGVFSLMSGKRIEYRSGLIPILISAAVVTGLAVPAFLRKVSVWYDIALFTAVLICALVYSACGKKTPYPIVKLGNISYSYYLLHYYTITLATHFFALDSLTIRNMAIAVLICTITWVISWISWYFIEHEFTMWLSSRFHLTDNRNKNRKENA